MPCMCPRPPPCPPPPPLPPLPFHPPRRGPPHGHKHAATALPIPAHGNPRPRPFLTTPQGGAGSSPACFARWYSASTAASRSWGGRRRGEGRQNPGSFLWPGDAHAPTPPTDAHTNVHDDTGDSRTKNRTKRTEQNEHASPTRPHTSVHKHTGHTRTKKRGKQKKLSPLGMQEARRGNCIMKRPLDG